eukprot:2446534-Ditylum_brightwellii.AAC.1
MPTVQQRAVRGVCVWMKTLPEVRCHILVKQDSIGLLVANTQSKKWTIMYSPKIEAIINFGNNSLEEIL